MSGLQLRDQGPAGLEVAPPSSPEVKPLGYSDLQVSLYNVPICHFTDFSMLEVVQTKAEKSEKKRAFRKPADDLVGTQRICGLRMKVYWTIVVISSLIIAGTAAGGKKIWSKRRFSTVKKLE